MASTVGRSSGWRRTAGWCVAAALFVTGAAVAESAAPGGEPPVGGPLRPREGLWLYLPFNGNAQDESGARLKTEVHGATLTTDRFGRPNRAYTFDGDDDYIIAPPNSRLDLGDSFTVSAWARTRDRQKIQSIVSQGNWKTETYRFTLRIYMTDIADFNTTDMKNWYDTVMPKRAEIDRWYHFVGVYDGGLKRIRFYVDGEPVSTTAIPAIAPVRGQAVVIGAGEYHGMEGHFNGDIDEVRVYSRALADREIRELHALESKSEDGGGLADRPAAGREGLVLHLPMNGNARDASGLGNHAEVHGATPAPDRFGRPDRAYQFDGVKDYILVPPSSSLDFAEAFTVSAWVRTTAVEKHQSIVRQGNLSAGTYRFALRLYLSDFFTFNTHDGEHWYEVSPPQQTQVKRWYHLVGVFAQKEVLRLYVDGKPVKATSYLDGRLAEAVTAPQMNRAKGQPVLIGAEQYRGVEAFFRGLIDDVRLYNRALSDRDVAELHALESNPE